MQDDLHLATEAAAGSQAGIPPRSGVVSVSAETVGQTVGSDPGALGAGRLVAPPLRGPVEFALQRLPDAVAFGHVDPSEHAAGSRSEDIRWPLVTRLFRVVLGVLLIHVVGCTGTTEDDGRPSLGEIACALPQRELLRIAHGYDPRRSGELQIVPRPPNYIGLFRSHSGPWDYLQRIPIFFYGPGHVPAVGRVSVPATIADVAPTLGAQLNFDLPTPDGSILHQAVRPSAGPPKVIVVVVWDGGGLGPLNRYPEAWPFLRSLIPRGAWFDGTVGSSPSVTPTIHASLGTGLFPANHGVVDLRMRVRGEIVSATEVGPQYLRKPSLADLYDRALGNRPMVGTVGLDQWHLVMSGRGALFPGGDRDLAALTDESQEYAGWHLPEDVADAFLFPSYLASFPGLDQSTEALDVSDGSRDDLWSNEVELSDPRSVLSSPAYSRYQSAIIQELLTLEGFGEDAVPDLFFTNFKQIDLVGHRWGMENWQMPAVIGASDAALSELVGFLDREVGEGEWVLALTADHGTTPPPGETGAFLIDRTELRKDIQARFDQDNDGRNVVEAPRVTEFWMDERELEDNGFTVRDVGRFVMKYTKAENARDPSEVPNRRLDDTLFSAAFPSSLLEAGLSCLGH
jgi:Type I phosphodiesterase / nucleotide pyrophosphatase